MKSSFKELLEALEIIFLPLFAWFIDIINIFPSWDSPAFYWDWTEPFYISFSLFNYLVVYFLVIIKQYIHDIWLYWVPLYSEDY